MADAIKWATGAEDRFRQWIDHELPMALLARGGLERQWLRWLTMYRAQRGGIKEFPFPGASNEVLPSIATDCNQLYAKFMQTLHAAPELWSVSALNERWVNVAKPMQDFLSLLDASVLRMYNVNKRALLEMCKLGTAIYKTGWTYESRAISRYDENGKPERARKTRSIPFVDHVRLFDFVIPPSSWAIDPDNQGGAPWVAERMRVSPERLKMLAKSSEPHLPNMSQPDIEKVMRWEEKEGTAYETHVEKQDYRRLANEPPMEPAIENQVQIGGASLAPITTVELWEIHARFPATEVDTYDDIVVLYHLPTHTTVRATLNPYAHGQRPYEVVRYFPGEGFYGIGVAEQKEAFQRMESDLYNFGLDAALLSNCIMIGAKAGSNILPGETWYPTKVWVTDGHPKDELMTMQFGRLDGSLQQFIGLTQDYGKRATGVSDIQMGNLDNLPGRTPATTMVAMLQEGNRRPDLTIKDMRYEGLSRVGLRIVQLIQQYMTKVTDVGQEAFMKVMVEALGMPEGQALKDQLLMPFDDAALGLGVTISASSGSSNKEVDKQNILALIQLAGQVAPQILQMTQLYVQSEQQMGPGNPVGQVALAAAKGTTELYRRALEQYDIRDPESIVPAPGTAGPVAPPPAPAIAPPNGNGMMPATPMPMPAPALV